jgi:hypothetical protein
MVMPRTLLRALALRAAGQPCAGASPFASSCLRLPALVKRPGQEQSPYPDLVALAVLFEALTTLVPAATHVTLTARIARG